EKLREQDKEVKEAGKVKGRELIGKYVKAPGIEREIIILPSYFCDPKKGTGIVTSVPSDAPDDYIGLRDLQTNEKECAKFGLDCEKIKKIKPIPIIDSKDLGNLAAVKVVEEMGIKNQHEREKLERAKKLVYKKGFYEGKMNENCGKYAGMPVEKAKVLVRNELIKKGEADVLYELTGKVVCRCLTECVVKIVSDQWFIEYNDPKWKKITHKCLSKLKLWPEKVRRQFEYVIDWLDHWACAREFGLGTRLPWDEKWVIESLSDSTLQMAYCTIAKYLQHPEDYGFSIDKLNDDFFDYVFLGKGNIEEVSKSCSIPADMLKIMRRDFEYWYPFDFRNSAKDLIQNHLAFCLFNHTAIFPEKYWPKAYEINGRIMIDGKKMSKSLGNFYTMRELLEKYGADLIRIASANAGEGLDDANFEFSFIDTAKKRFNEIYEFAKQNYGKGRENRIFIDSWFESMIHKSVKEATENLENMLFKSAVKTILFDMHRYLKWYMKRTGGDYNKELIANFVETQVKMLTPFAPHFCEEVWESIGKKPFVSNEKWPEYDEKKIDEKLEMGEKIIESVLNDINEVLKLAKIDKPKVIRIYVASSWKYKLFKLLRKTFEKTRDFREIMSEVMKNPDVRKHGEEVAKIIQKSLKAGGVYEVADQDFELRVFTDSKDFLEKEFGCKFEIAKAEESKSKKATVALPGKPGIEVG
ncbi:MAG: leucine--tRNA ligase, partial [Candidatus Aenigmarchaeota archaeon]|nr:leucine--tRNA ligase [Candidatus Aenigmarchaeota archaeon]